MNIESMRKHYEGLSVTVMAVRLGGSVLAASVKIGSKIQSTPQETKEVDFQAEGYELEWDTSFEG